MEEDLADMDDLEDDDDDEGAADPYEGVEIEDIDEGPDTHRKSKN